MKIMFVVTGLETGGAEMMLYKVLSCLDRLRIKCEVINLKHRGPVQDLIESIDVPVRALGLSSPLETVRGLYGLRRIVQDSQPALIQSWMYHANVIVAIATRLFGQSGPPLVWGVRYSLGDLSFEKRSTRWIIRRSPKLSRIPKVILYDSEAGRRDHEALGYPHDAGRVIPNGIDFNLWHADPEARNEVRSELGVDPDCFLIGMVGRLHPLKDHTTFLEAAERFMEVRPKAHFLLAGAGIEAENPVIRQLLSGRNLKGRLHLLGYRADVNRVMTALDLLSCASRAESFPNVVLEALACGVLSTVSEVGDAPRLVPDARFVVPPATPSALATAWDRIASLSPDQRKSLACDFRKTVMTRYSIATVAETYQSLYEELARRN